jgi:hypothetical protein
LAIILVKSKTDSIAFLDQAIPDSNTFLRVFGMNPNEILLEFIYHQYASVFILETLPFHGIKLWDRKVTLLQIN